MNNDELELLEDSRIRQSELNELITSDRYSYITRDITESIIDSYVDVKNSYENNLEELKREYAEVLLKYEEYNKRKKILQEEYNGVLEMMENNLLHIRDLNKFEKVKSKKGTLYVREYIHYSILDWKKFFSKLENEEIKEIIEVKKQKLNNIIQKKAIFDSKQNIVKRLVTHNIEIRRSNQDSEDVKETKKVENNLFT